ncbi:MAG: DNA polymerase III subunit delta [Cyanobacteria bacterium P01_C01_bin.89]
MAIYFFWGADDFAMGRAIATLQSQTLDDAWASFNFDKITAAADDPVGQALAQAMTPPFGSGRRLVWLVDTTLGQRCAQGTLETLDQTLPKIPDSTVLLLTAKNKLDGRLKSTKLLQKHAKIREFSPVPFWKTDALVKTAQDAAGELGIKLAPDAAEALALAVGNQTRQLYNELEKLKLFTAASPNAPIPAATVNALVATSTQTSIALADSIRQGKTAEALGIVGDLIARNEAPIPIVATVVGKFRTWLWIKALLVQGERDDRAIARAADVSNPKRIFYFKREVQPLSLPTLEAAVGVLLDLEFILKRGGHPLETLQTKVIELCDLCGNGVDGDRRKPALE